MDNEETSGSGVRVVSVAGSRFRGGLFLRSIEFHADRVVFQVFTSRPTSFVELRERMTLRDGVGTEYVMQPFEDIDGKGTFEFMPGLSPDARSFQFGEPGRGLIVAERIEESDRLVVDRSSAEEGDRR